MLIRLFEKIEIGTDLGIKIKDEESVPLPA
jgi:hypothetical protein